MFSMCQKLFKALCMYYLPRDHIISGIAGIQSQAVRLESDVFCLIPPPWGGSQIFFRQMENYWVWGGGGQAVLCAHEHVWWGRWQLLLLTYKSLSSLAKPVQEIFVFNSVFTIVGRSVFRIDSEPHQKSWGQDLKKGAVFVAGCIHRNTLKT